MFRKSEPKLIVRIPLHLLTKFKLYCHSRDLTMSQYIRQHLVSILSAEEKNA